MTEHRYSVTVAWSRGDSSFGDGGYSRDHEWRFDGGTVVAASASPSVVGPERASAESVDPEEAFVAAVASCHMLTFLDLARRGGFQIDAYTDAAEATMARLERGRWWVDKVTLRPHVLFSGGKVPGRQEFDELHEKAHQLCFIANSVRSEIAIVAELETA